MPSKNIIDWHVAKIQYVRETHIISCNLACAKFRKNASCECNCHAGQKTIDSQDLYNNPE